jgi:hypothetical protein
MGVRYVKQGLQLLAGKGFQQKWAGKLFLEVKRNFTKISFLKILSKTKNKTSPFLRLVLPNKISFKNFGYLVNMAIATSRNVIATISLVIASISFIIFFNFGMIERVRDILPF